MLPMDNLDFNIKNDRKYKLGVDSGFFIGFLLFASAFYMLMSLLKKLPASIRYYHVVLFVIIVYFVGFIFLKLRK